MKNTISKVLGVAFLAFTVAVSGFPLAFSAPQAHAAGAFNADPQDFPVIEVSNYSRNPGSNAAWSNSISGVRAGDTIAFVIYGHNTGDSDATNTRVSLDLRETGSSMTGFGRISADNAGAVSGVARVNFSGVSSPSLTYVGGEYYKQSTLAPTTPDALPSGQKVSQVAVGGVNLGTLPNDPRGNYNNDFQLVVRYRVDGNNGGGTCTSSPTLRISPSNASINVNGSAQYRAYYDADGNCSGGETDVTSQSNWSSNSGIATHIGSGLFRGVINGTTNVTANYSGMSRTASLTVNGGGGTCNGSPSLRVTPSQATVNVNGSAQYRAYYDSDGLGCGNGEIEVTSQSNWNSNSGNAVYQGSGLFRGVFQGFSNINATYQGLTQSASINVVGNNGNNGNPTLTVSPSQATVSQGGTFQYRAYYDADGPSGSQGQQDVTNVAFWSSNNSSIGTSNGNGIFRGVNNGSTGIRANYAGLSGNAVFGVTGGSTNTCTGNPTLVISPSSANVAVGTNFQYTALYDADGPSCPGAQQNVTTLAGWSAVNTSIATNTARGNFRGASAGNSGILATYNGLTASGNLNVIGTGGPGPVVQPPVVVQPPIVISQPPVVIGQPTVIGQPGIVVSQQPTTSFGNVQGVSCLTVTPSVDVTELLPNQEFVYTTLYRNDCPFALNNPTLRVFLPNEVDFLASSNPFFIREGNKLSYNIGVLPVGGQGSVAITGYVRKDAELGDTLVFNSTLEFIDFNNQVQSATSYLTAVLGGDITRSFTANIGDALGNIFSSIWFWFLLLLLIIAGIVWFFATRSRNNTVVVAADRRDDPLRALRDA